MVERLVLVGMMGAGKTTVGRMVADHLGWGYLDSDEQVMAATGRSVAELFTEQRRGCTSGPRRRGSWPRR